MFDYQEKRKIRSWLYSKTAVIVILALTVLLSISTYERYTVEREMYARQRVREAELKELEARSALLENKVEHLENERGVEEELRSRFDVAKNGERVVVIIDETGATTTNLDAMSFPPGGDDGETDEGFFDFLKFW